LILTSRYSGEGCDLFAAGPANEAFSGTGKNLKGPSMKFACCSGPLVVALVIFSLEPLAKAQQSPARSESRTQLVQEEASAERTVDLDILIQSQPVYRVKAQEWGRALQDLGFTPQFRQPKPGEETRVEDIDEDGKLSVRVVCGMSPDGSIRVGNRKFTIADTEQLKGFLNELAQFGAEGPPDKTPRWGMTDVQLQDFLKLLSEPVTEQTRLQSPLVTVESLGLPAGVRMRFADEARESALGLRPPTAPESMDLIGYSKGTAVAIVLAQYGLGFRPHRVAADSYEIEIDLGGEANNLWPVGWKTQETTAVTLPAYLKSIPVDVENADISALLQVVSDRLKLPVYRSSFALAAAGRDLDELTYTRKKDKVSPSRLLSAIGDKHQLGFDVRVDEAGKLFLWATTSEDSSAFRTRFAHVKQKTP
jgi:hypothetical protein